MSRDAGSASRRDEVIGSFSLVGGHCFDTAGWVTSNLSRPGTLVFKGSIPKQSEEEIRGGARLMMQVHMGSQDQDDGESGVKQ